ncbi:MAG: universal stress protein [Nitrososphaerota archaeon]|nr:universal stress protein [Nitrososphaerota archaeon]
MPVELVGFRKVLVATDGSENAERATDTAIEIAKRYQAKLVVVNIVPPPGGLMLASESATPQSAVVTEQYYKNSRTRAKKLVDRVASKAKAEGVDVVGRFADGSVSVVEMITRLAEEEKADLVVVGTRGLAGFKKLLLGSVSGGVVTHAHCSVLVVR